MRSRKIARTVLLLDGIARPGRHCLEFEYGESPMKKQKSGLALALLCAVMAAGCTTLTVQGDKSVISSSMGSLGTTEEVTTKQATAAARSVLSQLGFAITNEQAKDGRITLTARGAHDQKVVVRIEAVTDKLTNIQVRGTGSSNRETQLLLLNKIRAKAASED
jgi:ABC-type glycerol-3-phosphate transport system substrate-binding protein